MDGLDGTSHTRRYAKQMLLQEAKMYLASLIFDSALLILSVHAGDGSLSPEFVSGFAVVAVVETFWLLMGRGLRN